MSVRPFMKYKYREKEEQTDSKRCCRTKPTHTICNMLRYAMGRAHESKLES